MTTSDRADLESEWQSKGATLSDKTARKEFGLTQDEIVQAIRARKLQYREGSMFGNPWLRLLRREVEAIVKKKHGVRVPNENLGFTPSMGAFSLHMGTVLHLVCASRDWSKAAARNRDDEGPHRQAAALAEACFGF